MRFWWLIVMLGTVASGILLFVMVSGEMGLTAIQEPTVVAFALALSILPYIWARSIEGWGRGSEKCRRTKSENFQSSRREKVTASPPRGFDLGRREEGEEVHEEGQPPDPETGR